MVVPLPLGFLAPDTRIPRAGGAPEDAALGDLTANTSDTSPKFQGRGRTPSSLGCVTCPSVPPRAACGRCWAAGSRKAATQRHFSCLLLSLRSVPAKSHSEEDFYFCGNSRGGRQVYSYTIAWWEQGWAMHQKCNVGFCVFCVRVAWPLRNGPHRGTALKLMCSSQQAWQLQGQL